MPTDNKASKPSDTTAEPDVKGDARTDAAANDEGPAKRVAEKKVSTSQKAAGQQGDGSFVATAEEPSAADKEWEKAGVDPRLDNRMGHQRPPQREWPAVPQQVDGPEVGEDFSAHYPAEGKKFRDEEADFKAAGMQSKGPHGLGDDDEDSSDGATVVGSHRKTDKKKD